MGCARVSMPGMKLSNSRPANLLIGSKVNHGSNASMTMSSIPTDDLTHNVLKQRAASAALNPRYSKQNRQNHMKMQ